MKSTEPAQKPESKFLFRDFPLKPKIKTRPSSKPSAVKSQPVVAVAPIKSIAPKTKASGRVSPKKLPAVAKKDATDAQSIISEPHRRKRIYVEKKEPNVVAPLKGRSSPPNPLPARSNNEVNRREKKVSPVTTAKRPEPIRRIDLKSIPSVEPLPVKEPSKPVLPHIPGHALLFENDLFETPRGMVTDGLRRLKSYFSDTAAVEICEKMAGSYARGLVVAFNKSSAGINRDKYLYELHFLANKARSIYGGPILTFLLGLRQLEFGNSSAFKLNSLPSGNECNGATADFPALTFVTKGQGEYTLIFQLQEADDFASHNARSNVRLYSNEKRMQVASINRQGRVVDPLLRASASIDIFCSYIKTTNELDFRAGVEDGFCLVCDAKLTDSVSRRYGIGPDCRKRILCSYPNY